MGLPIFWRILLVCEYQCLQRLTMALCRAYRSNRLKHSSAYEAFLPFFSPILLFIFATLWVILSPSNILELQPRIFYMMVGTAFSNVTVSTTRSPPPLIRLPPLSVRLCHSLSVCRSLSHPLSVFSVPLPLCMCISLSLFLCSLLFLPLFPSESILRHH